MTGQNSNINTVLIGDCAEQLKRLPSGSVHCVITSPPYWGLRDYGMDGQLGLEESPRQYLKNMVSVFSEVRRVLRDDGTLWINVGDSYNAAGRKGHGTRIGAKKGTNRASATGQDHHRPHAKDLKPKDLVGIPWRLAFALQEDGWYLRSDIIWHKPNPMPESVRDRPTKSHEYLFLLTKSEKYFYDHVAVKEPAVMKASQNEKRNQRTVWTIPTKPFPGAHFAVMPEALAEPCLLAGTSGHGACAECGAPWKRVVEVQKVPDRAGRDVTTGWEKTCSHDSCITPCVVLDPFFGAGTVGVVAERHGRSWVGCEISPEYTKIANQRLKDTRPEPKNTPPWATQARGAKSQTAKAEKAKT